MGKFIPVEPEKWAEMVKAQAENARLKAEVERLQSIHSIDSIGIEQLKAQVERLTKAGNALHAFLINYIVESRISSAYLNKLDDEWLAAKEGKQS